MAQAQTLIRPLHEGDLDALYRIRQIAFLDNLSLTNPAVQATHLATLDYKYGRFVDGRLASSASWYPFEMYLGGKRTVVAGLASVVSAAETRRQGHVRALLSHGLEMLRDQDIAWCLEYPFDTRYYRRFGWETVANGSFVEVPIERFRRFDSPGTIQRVEPDDTSLGAIQRIHSAWASAYNFTMARTDSIRPHWERILDGDPWHDDDARFVFLSEHAYCVLKISSKAGAETLLLLDYAFETPAGRETIFAFMNHFAGQVDTVRLQLATDDPLALEWSNFTVAHPHPLHARIVDAAQALTGWQTAEDFAFAIEVRDDFCEWNNATFAVAVEDGLTVARRVDAEADLSADIRGLAQVLSGSVSASAARQTGVVTGDAESIAKLSSLATRPCFMALSDYF
jgi:predicted acetyltransferase